jgi:hypothetical protein
MTRHLIKNAALTLYKEIALILEQIEQDLPPPVTLSSLSAAGMNQKPASTKSSVISLKTTASASILFESGGDLQAILDLLMLLIENYHFLAVRLATNRHTSFFTPETLVSLKSHSECAIQLFCSVLLHIYFPEFLDVVKKLAAGQNNLQKAFSSLGSLKDLKKAILSISKKILKMLSKEFGLFPILWHQFEKAFKGFFMDEFFVAYDAAPLKSTYRMTFTQTDIKSIFDDIPLQI